MGKRLRQLPAALLLAALLAGCAAAAPAAQSTALPASPVSAHQTADMSAQPGGSGKAEMPPTRPSTVPDKNGYAEYARFFYEELIRGDAISASSYLYFRDEEERTTWIERFAELYNPSLEISRVEPNLWAAVVRESFGSEIPAEQTVYYVAWYDGDYRIFNGAGEIPEELPLDVDCSAMSVIKPGTLSGGITPDGIDEFPPEDGQTEQWYRDRQAELAAVKAAADKAVRALPEADTVTSFDDPKVELVDAKTVDFIKIEPRGSKLLLYRVTYQTTADAILGPIVVYLDREANVLAFAPRE